MPKAADIHLSPTEAARKLGVSAKALRLYERHGLIKPLRASNGWRAYGPAEMARLHQVLALKGLGLPLRRIAELLAGRFGTLDAVLELQQELLQRQADRLGRALTLVKNARKRLASGANLSVDDLANLTTETTMTTKVTQEELGTVLKPMMEKHFSVKERAELHTRRNDHPEAAATWLALFAEAERLMAIGDPTSPEALDLGRRWKAMVDAFTGGDPTLESKVTGVWMDAFADPTAAFRLPATPAMFKFVWQAIRSMKTSQDNP